MSRRPRTPSSPQPRPVVTFAAIAALAVLGALPFLQTLRFTLVLDDPLVLTEVGRTAGEHGSAQLFASDFRLKPDFHLGYYRPVATWSLWHEIKHAWRSGGAEALPSAARSLHATNLALHVMCTLLVWGLVRRVGVPAWSAWLAAALFAVIPSHVEPVSYVSSRCDLLATMFVLASTVCWLELSRATGPARLALLIAGPLLALGGALAKEQALLLPLLLVAWSWALPGMGARRGWIALWVIAAGVAVWLRVQVAHVPFGGERTVQGTGTGSLAWFVRLGLPALAVYARMWFVPWPLNPYYMRPHLALGWPAAVALMATIACIVLARRRGRSREAFAALVLALVFLLPVMHLAPLQGAVAAERFFYLPSVGFALLTALALSELDETRRARAFTRAAAGVAIASCAVLSSMGARTWANDKALFTRMVATSPLAPHAHQGLAEALAKEGNYAESARECREAIRLNPDYPDPYEQLGIVSAKLGDYALARRSFEQALRLEPNRTSAHENLGVLAMNQDNVGEALPHFQRAVELDPGSPRLHYELGLALGVSGDARGAAREVAILDGLDAKTAARLRDELASMGSGAAP